MPDRRAKTSRANLGEHIPEALGPEGTAVIAVRVPLELLREIDAFCTEWGWSRSDYVRAALNHTGATIRLEKAGLK